MRSSTPGQVSSACEPPARPAGFTAGVVTRLLCGISRHQPVARRRWNQGFCFSTCRRCGRDLVRTAFGPWHVPHGYKVVWKQAGDPGAPQPRHAGGKPPYSGYAKNAPDTLPIQDVLRRIDAGDFMNEGHEDEPAAAASVAVERDSSNMDFMDDSDDPVWDDDAVLELRDPAPQAEIKPESGPEPEPKTKRARARRKRVEES